MPTNFNIVMPLAGRQSRFFDAGFSTPKPFIDIHGVPIFKHSINSVGIEGNVFYIVQSEHMRNPLIRYKMEQYGCGGKIIETNGITAGQLSSIMLAAEFINNDDPLIICNCDHRIVYDSNLISHKLFDERYDGGLVSFYSPGSEPKYSYIKMDKYGICEIAEKKKISDFAASGIYAFLRGSDFVHYAKQVFDKNITVNGEFYLSSVYSEMIEDGAFLFNVLCRDIRNLGTPEEFRSYYDTFGSFDR